MDSHEDLVSEFDRLQTEADKHHRKAEWEGKFGKLQEMLDLCGKPYFPESAERRQRTLYQLGELRRRFGQYEIAIKTLEQALEVHRYAPPLRQAEILGELGVVYRHSNDYDKARETFKRQYDLGRQGAHEAELAMCRAVGNEGMSAYNLSQQTVPPDADLLDIAYRQLTERVTRARVLHERLKEEDPGSRYFTLSKTWEFIGMDRLTLVLVAQGKTAEAVARAEESQSQQNEWYQIRPADPTIRGYSKFFYGHALWYNGQKLEATQQWTAPIGTCGSAHALCKEPALEHVGYLKLLAQADINFDSYDEQGYSALDYAYLSNSQDAQQMVQVMLESLKEQQRRTLSTHTADLSGEEIEKMINDLVEEKLHQSNLRKHYRKTLQEEIRPKLRSQEDDAIASVRGICAKLIADADTAHFFDDFDYIKYNAFKEYGRMPRSDVQKSQRFAVDEHIANAGRNEDHIVFFSYRWIGAASEPKVEGPDSADHIQYRRMLNAMEAYLARNRRIKPDNVGIWLDYTCIDQDQPDRRLRGIDSLPLAVLQCDAMISLVDEEYWTRAWCGVEVALMRELVQSYGLHQLWEHRLISRDRDLLLGDLSKPKTNNTRNPIIPAALKLSNNEDRPKIDFLLRQSKLLGKDDA